MAAPFTYTWGYSFTEYQRTNPNRPLPGDQLDNELQNIQQFSEEANAALSDIRRSDGKLQNRIVTHDSLATDVLTGMLPPVQWTSNTTYQSTATVFNGAIFYAAKAAHTSGATFDPTLWTFLADFSAGAVSDSGIWFSGIDTPKTADYVVLSADAGKMLVANSGSAIKFTFDSTSSLGNGVFLIRNANAGVLTVTAASGQSIEGVANPAGLQLARDWFAIVWASGSTLRATLIASYKTMVQGPAVAVSGNFVSFSDTTGKTLGDSGISPAILGTFLTLPEIVQANDYTIQATDIGKMHVANKASAINFTLPSLGATSGSGVYQIRNIGAGALTVTCAGSDTIEGSATMTVRQGNAAIIWSNGAVWKASRFYRYATQAEAQAGVVTDVAMSSKNVADAIAAQVNFTVAATTVYTASQTWNKPADLGDNELVAWEAIGSGGGGLSGGGGGGGSSGVIYMRGFEQPSTISLIVGGTTAAATDGSSSSVGSGPPYVAFGGGGGKGQTAGGAGGGGKAAAVAGTPGAGWDGRDTGGAGGGSNAPGVASYNGGGGGGGGVVSAVAGGISIRGGGGGATNVTTSTAGVSFYAGAGGGPYNGTSPQPGNAPGGGGGGGGPGATGARGEIRFTRFGAKV